jgi:anthranilate phosphoribosyltransferase
VWVVREGGVWETSVSPEDVGLPVADPAALRGGDAAHNAEVTRRFLDGERGPIRDDVLLNSAAALVALEDDDQALDERLPDALRAGLDRAAASVDDGSAAAALDRWVSTSQRLAATAR